MSEREPDQRRARGGAANLTAVTYTKATNWKPVWRGGESQGGTEVETFFAMKIKQFLEGTGRVLKFFIGKLQCRKQVKLTGFSLLAGSYHCYHLLE